MKVEYLKASPRRHGPAGLRLALLLEALASGSHPSHSHVIGLTRHMQESKISGLKNSSLQSSNGRMTLNKSTFVRWGVMCVLFCFLYFLIYFVLYFAIIFIFGIFTCIYNFKKFKYKAYM